MSADNKDKLIEVLQRKVEREKAAKEQSEIQLEEYSRKVYSSNELLLQQTKSAIEKQQHLAFIMNCAKDNWHIQNATSLVQNFLNMTYAFMPKSTSFYFQMDEQNKPTDILISDPEAFRTLQQPLKVNKEQIVQCVNELNVEKIVSAFSDVSKGKLFRLDDIVKSDMADYQLFLLPINTHIVDDEGGNENGFLGFMFTREWDVNELKLETIETSQGILSVALDRLFSENLQKKQLIELQNSNKEIAQMQQQLVESEKLASLGLLSAGVAHEINNPIGFVASNVETMHDNLTSINESIELITAEANNDQLKILKEMDTNYLIDDSKDIIRSSLAGLRRVKEIVSDLQQFARMEDSEDLHFVELDKVIKQALNVIANELKYDYQVDLDLQDNVAIWGNEGQLQQVFINLFMNAKQAMPEGGTLSISCLQIKERIVVKIKDEGCGIEENNLKEIFTPFFTTKPAGQGTGLGLSISYGILQQHHAKVSVASEVNKGTEFTLSFIKHDQ